jgi:hypothetical protein
MQGYAAVDAAALGFNDGWAEEGHSQRVKKKN